MIAHLRITCATGISRLRGDPLLHPYRLPTIGSSLKIHPQLLPISAFTYDMKYHSRIQNEMQGVEMKRVSVKFSSVIHLTVDNYYLRGFGFISISV
jgi:hypothetical protein